MGVNISRTSSEPDTVKVATDKKKKSYDFNDNQARNAKYDTEKEFHETLPGGVPAHELALLDYYEYLADPASWFVKTEHPSLDAG